MKRVFSQVLSVFAVVCLIFFTTLVSVASHFEEGVFEKMVNYAGLLDESEIIPGTLLVKYKQGVRAAEKNQLILGYQITKSQSMTRTLGIEKIYFKGDLSSTIDLCRALNKDPRVEYADLNVWFYLSYVPNDPWAIDDGNYTDGNPDQFWLSRVDAHNGWDYTTGDPDIVIAIIDSGVDLDHPDLAANIWTNPGEIPGNGIDDDGNGYVDDVHGYDFAGSAVGALFGDVDDEDSNPDVFYPDPSCGNGIDDNWLDGAADPGVGHGTHCAGLAAGVMDNGVGITGVSGHCSIMAVRVMNAEGSGQPGDIVAGIEYAVAAGADVISMSLGMARSWIGAPAGMEDACNLAYQNGIPVIAASGNGASDGSSNGVSFPAAFASTFAVGSCNTLNQRSRFSDFGGATGSYTDVDVCAFGGEINAAGDGIEEGIWSTYVVSVAGAGNGYNAGDSVYAGAVGTSMATPEVAGLAGLVKSMNPNLSAAQVYNYMRDGAVDIGAPGWDEETGYGKFNLELTLAPLASATASIN
ncbi:S8 family serine peptidase [candidate division CSSED10-310 bacterium]|uniref:S8 family serine peptidase n=1 Tax=candidate division CSSED10-310 bacterium TaxID=2855610 RepID=A0ABV6YS35_UNCC1